MKTRSTFFRRLAAAAAVAFLATHAHTADFVVHSQTNGIENPPINNIATTLVDTGIAVNVGDTVALTVNPTDTWSLNGTPVNAAGFPYGFGGGHNVYNSPTYGGPNHDFGALVYTIDGANFGLVGDGVNVNSTGVTFTATVAGVLKFGHWDSISGDNGPNVNTDAIITVSAVVTPGTTTVIDDDFDDNVIGTNTLGTGNGFISYSQSALPTESGGFLNLDIQDGAATRTFVSNPADAVNPFGTANTTQTFTFGDISRSTLFQRFWMGYRATGSTTHFFPNMGVQGLYLSVLSQNQGEDGWQYHGNLIAVSDTGAMTSLATWTWADPDALSGISITLSTTATTYAMAFSGAAGGTPNFVTGAASGALTGMGTLGGNYDTCVYNQYWFSTPGGVKVDSVHVQSGGAPPPPPAPAPEIAVEQPAASAVADGGSRSFGLVTIGNDTTREFSIKNTGNADLTGLGISIDGADAADFTVTINPVAPVVGPGSTTFTVRFAPTTGGGKVAALHIANNDANENPYDITLTGIGSTGAGSNVLIIRDFSDPHTNAQTDALKTALENAGHAVTFSAAEENNYDGTNPSPAGFDAVIHLNGVIWYSAMTAAGQAALTSYTQAGGVYIGGSWNSYEVGSTPGLRELVLFDYAGENTGPRTYTTIPAQAGHPLLAGIPSPFTFNTGYVNCLLHTFAANPSTALMTDDEGNPSVAIRNVGAGIAVEFSLAPSYNSSSALSNANVQQLYINAVALAGGGGPPAAPEIAVEESALDIADGGSRDFGTALIGGNSSLTFTVKNTGNADLTGLGITIDGADSADFAVTANPTAPVAGPLGSTTFTVTFAPATFGAKTAALHIASNDADEASFDIALGGNVAAPFALVNDAATTTVGTTRIYPLANDTNAGAIIAVSDPAITIDGRSLVIPAGFTGSFTYNTSNGVANGQAAVDVSAGTPLATPTKWQGLLYDDTGAIAGIVKASRTRNNITASVTIGAATGRVVFSAAGATGVAFGLGKPPVPATLDGVLGADNRVAITIVTGGETFTADLRPQRISATPEKHTIALAGADVSVVPGGGFARASVAITARMLVSGKLPDGRPFSAGSALLDNGSFVLYRGIGKTVPKAFIGGEITAANLTATDVTGEIEWNLPPQAAGLHAAGLSAVLTANGCVFTPGAPLPSGPVTLTLSGANLAADIIVASTANNGTVAKTLEVPSFIGNPLKGTFAAKVKHPALARPVSASGVFLQKSGTAWGYFPGTTVGGSISLTQP